MTAWEGSNRAAELPPDWPARRAAILHRDGYRCRWIRSTGDRCPEPATDVDHIRCGNDHEPSNLRALCRWHHQYKSSSEGGRAAAARRPPRRRPPEPHPGELTQ